MPFFAALDRWLDRLYLWCGYAAALLLVALALLILTSIVSRLLGVYLPGLTEYSGYVMAGASFLALANTLRSGGHIRVGILLKGLNGRARRGLEIWCLVMGTALSWYLAYYLVRMTRVSHQLEDRSEGADAMLLWIPQSLVAFGAVVLAVCFLHCLVAFLAGRADPTMGPGGLSERAAAEGEL